MGNAHSIDATGNLIQRLRNSDADIRYGAVKTLAARTDIETIRLLLPYLKDGNKDFRQCVLSALLHIKNPLKRSLLGDLLKDKSPLVRAAVIRILADKPGKTSAALLMKALSDKNVEVRKTVPVIFWLTRYTYGYRVLLMALKDKDVEIRKAVISTLSWSRIKCSYGYSGYRILKVASRDKNQTIRENAVEALSLYNVKDMTLVKPVLMAIRNKVRFYSFVMKAGVKVLRNIGNPAAGILIGELNNPDWRIRAASAAALVPIKDVRAVLPLINALKDRHPALRNWARAALAEIGAPSVMPLMNALRNGDYYTKSGCDTNDKSIGHIAWTLIEIGPPAERPLLGALRDNNVNVRAAAVAALAEMQSRSALPLIIEKLKDDNKKVRLNAIIALEKYRDRRAVEPLIASLQEKDVRLRQAAVKALGGLHDKKAAPALIRMLKDTDTTLKYGERGVTGVLGELHDTRATCPLIELLHDKTLDSGAPARALGKLKDARAVPALVTALEHPNQNVRSSAAWALGDIKDRRAVKPLIFILRRGSDADISQFNVAQAIGKIGDKTAFKHLIWAAKSKDRELRRGAAAGLAELKDPRVEKYLLILSKDGDNYVSKAAGEALREMKNIPELPRALEVALEMCGTNDINSLLGKLNSKSRDISKIGVVEALLEFANRPQVKKEFLRALKNRDLEIIAGAHPFFIRKGYPGSEDFLIRALQEYGEYSERMPEAFLYSGNNKLSSAALSWSRQQGRCLRCENKLLMVIFRDRYGETGKMYPWGGKEPGKGYGCDA